MLTTDDLKQLTALHLKEWPAVKCMDEIVKGGSDRHFYRLQFNPEAPSVILMTYTAARADNLRFVSASRKLQDLGVNVPTILAHDEAQMCVWLEDLGDVDLHSFREESWQVRRPLYQAALAEVAKLHQVQTDALSTEELAQMEPGFDEALYGWEQDYFVTHYVGGLRKLKKDQVPESVRSSLDELRRRLASLPRGLVHRDFQSQNLMVREGDVWLIDYQGVRPGLAEYDLASILLDPYVEMTEEERQELLGWYADHVSRSAEEVHERYLLCAAQRLMQALGAYGNLSLHLGKPQFAAHVPVAVARLRMICEQHAMLRVLGTWLSRI